MSPSTTRPDAPVASGARRKLAETRFFLNHLEGETRTTRQNWDAFVFYLSAFLNAGRSVIFRLRKWGKKGFNRVLFPTWRDALPREDRDLFDFMEIQRDLEVHEREAEAQHHTGSIPITEVRHESGISRFGGPYLTTVFGDDFASMPRVGVLAPRFEIGGHSLDAVEACRRYVGLLEALVSACEQSAVVSSGGAG